MTAFKPYGEYVIVRPELKAESERESGVVLPAVAEEMRQRGVVVTAPKDSGLTENDRVIFASNGGFHFRYEGQLYMALKPEYILAVLDFKAKLAALSA